MKCDQWDRRESGSTLVLAIVFLAVVGTVVGALVFGIGNDLLNGSNLTYSRGVNYAASGAANVAAWSGRFTHTTTAANGVCTGIPLDSNGDSSVEINGKWVAVFCATTQTATNPLTNQVNREYQIWACLTAPSVTSASSFTTCKASYNLYAEVYFNDFSTGGGVDNCTSPPSASPSCGLGMTVSKWIVKSQ